MLSPGLRLGYVVSPPAVVRKIEEVKQAADLHTSTLTQMVVHEVVASGFMDHHLQGVRTLYARQRQAMLEALADHLPPSVAWTRPTGGMFIWLTLPEHVDTARLLEDALTADVAFVPGAAFFGDKPPKNISFYALFEVSVFFALRLVHRSKS